MSVVVDVLKQEYKNRALALENLQRQAQSIRDTLLMCEADLASRQKEVDDFVADLPDSIRDQVTS